MVNRLLECQGFVSHHVIVAVPGVGEGRLESDVYEV